MTDKTLTYIINDPRELNLSYMPFIATGGLFVPTNETAALGDRIMLELKFAGRGDPLMIDGRVIWITPQNALHHVLPGIGIQFTGENAASIRGNIEKMLEPTMDVGGYTYGITDGSTKNPR